MKEGWLPKEVGEKVSNMKWESGAMVQKLLNRVWAGRSRCGVWG